MVDQFVLEVKLQSYLYQEYILSLYTLFDDKDSLYLVLEYMDDGTLFAHLKKNRVLGENEVSVMIKQIASAIKYLHEN
jgi:non-specific serine/threonine protein kinase